MDEEANTAATGTEAGASAGPRVFLNYRHDDVGLGAVAIRDRLIERLGDRNVFLDSHSLAPGMRWTREIASRSAGCDFLLALIGTRWLGLLEERRRSGKDDYVRRELEQALRNGSTVRVIPVLLDDAAPPPPEKLPPSLAALAETEAARVSSKQLDEDVARLLTRLEAIAAEPPRREEPPAPLRPAVQPAPSTVAPAPDTAHYDGVLDLMLDEGSVVPVLGSGLGAGEGPWHEGCEWPPDAEDLALYLAKRFKLTDDRQDLAAVAQQITVTKGAPDLYRRLRQALSADRPPGQVQRALAGFPGRVRAAGLEPRYQLILSTGYDSALELAFRAEDEPYDLVVYMASGRDRGKFVHFPYEGGCTAIGVPNEYADLPVDDDGELERTIIVKLHGAVDGQLADYRWRDNYVVTEDQYIEYLSQRPVEGLVPADILAKLTSSHWLFLGYTAHDWNLRVFLQRVWGGEPLAARSWAVERDPDELEKQFWRRYGVELFATPVTTYLDQLAERLRSRRAADA